MGGQLAPSIPKHTLPVDVGVGAGVLEAEGAGDGEADELGSGEVEAGGSPGVIVGKTDAGELPAPPPLQPTARARLANITQRRMLTW